MEEKLLEVRDLSVEYRVKDKVMRAIDDMSFDIEEGEILGVAGESGCGKSSLGHTIMRLLPRAGKISQGKIIFNGKDLLKLSEEKMDKEIRGKQITMIFQDPQHALNPVFTIETQMTDIMRFYSRRGKKKVNHDRKYYLDKAVKLLKETGIAGAEERIKDYPFQFSGGMKQRVMIAMAFTSSASLLICDEPTTALDVTIEAQILELIKELANKHKYAILYISHNLGVISELCNRVMVMYTGRVIEMSDSQSLFEKPRHPYTRSLLESLPGEHIAEKGKRLATIPGHVPPLNMLPEGCTFHPRCAFAEDICNKEKPELTEAVSGHWSACLLDDKVRG